MNDVIHPADLSIYKNCCGTKPSDNDSDCGCNGGYVWMPGPHVPPPPVDYPCPPPFFCPPPPPAPPCNCEEEVQMKKSSKESQICKLSKKAAIINRMIEGLKTKKKDFIIKVGDTSYNFGNIDLEVKEWKSTSEGKGNSYAETALDILEKELSLIKSKIAELATELGDEIDGISLLGISKTVVDDLK